MNKPRIDIIVPCYNEANHLPKTLSTIINLTEKKDCEFKIILMDNGSVDGSMDVAQSFGIETAADPKATIGSLRNQGVRQASEGDLLVFLDADMEVTELWVRSVCRLVHQNITRQLLITGYPCRHPIDASWLEKHWFHGDNIVSNYINSGNMITTPYLFNLIDGFDHNLKTGEDWDFCQRARNIGAEIALDSDFKVYHHGYPKTLYDFFKREMWHGIGDCSDLKTFVQSKPAIISFLVGIFCVLGITFILSNTLRLAAVILLLMSTLPAVVLSTRRSRTVWHIPGNILIAFVYLLGRFGSLWLVFWQGLKSKSGNERFRWR
jgi:glycosyltransferase involved in cell wall biosynthesis